MSATQHRRRQIHHYLLQTLLLKTVDVAQSNYETKRSHELKNETIKIINFLKLHKGLRVDIICIVDSSVVIAMDNGSNKLCVTMLT